MDQKQNEMITHRQLKQKYCYLKKGKQRHKKNVDYQAKLKNRIKNAKKSVQKTAHRRHGYVTVAAA